MSLSKHIHLLFFTIVFLLVMGGCDNFLSNSDEKTTFPKTGQTPLPDIAGTSYQSQINSDPKGNHHTLSSSNAPEIDWGVVEPLLKKAQQQTDSRYAAVYSVKKNSEGRYNYETAPLEFSPKAFEEAGDAIQPFFFLSANNLDSPIQLLAAYIPDSQLAIKEMKQWIQSKRKPGTVIKNPNSKETKTDAQTSAQCFVMDTKYYVFDSNGNLIQTVVVGHYEDCGVSSGGGDDSGSGGDVPCSVQLIPSDDCPGESDPCPYNCGGNGGSGSDNDSEVNFPSQLNNDFTANVDTTNIDCNNTNLSEKEKAWCASSIPTGNDLNATNTALDNIEQRGSSCAEIAQEGRQLLDNYGLRYYPNDDNQFSFGGVGGPNFGVILQRTWLTEWIDKVGEVTDVDGSQIKVNFEYALVHEIEHAMNRGHILASNGQQSAWRTEHAVQCSGL